MWAHLGPLAAFASTLSDGKILLFKLFENRERKAQSQNNYQICGPNSWILVQTRVHKDLTGRGSIFQKFQPVASHGDPV